MTRKVLLCRSLKHLRSLVVELEHHVVNAVHDADLIVTTDPGLSAPATEVLQFGGAVLDTSSCGGQYAPVPAHAGTWRITAAADMLELAPLAHATLLTDPPSTGLRWTGDNPSSEPEYATPLVTADSGHHAAAIIHRSCGGTLWWVSEHTLDTAPWLDAVLQGPFCRGLPWS